MFLYIDLYIEIFLIFDIVVSKSTYFTHASVYREIIKSI